MKVAGIKDGTQMEFLISESSQSSCKMARNIQFSVTRKKKNKANDMSKKVPEETGRTGERQYSKRQ